MLPLSMIPRTDNSIQELRPEMVDYIIFSALDSLKHKLPSGSIQGQTAFQKVRDQLPAHSVEQLSQISNYVVQQLEVQFCQVLRLHASPECCLGA